MKTRKTIRRVKKWSSSIYKIITYGLCALSIAVLFEGVDAYKKYNKRKDDINIIMIYHLQSAVNLGREEQISRADLRSYRQSRNSLRQDLNYLEDLIKFEVSKTKKIWEISRMNDLQYAVYIQDIKEQAEILKKKANSSYNSLERGINTYKNH